MLDSLCVLHVDTSHAPTGIAWGDRQISGNTLHVRLDAASAPRRSKALAALCVELTDTAARYPAPT